MVDSSLEGSQFRHCSGLQTIEVRVLDHRGLLKSASALWC